MWVRATTVAGAVALTLAAPTVAPAARRPAPKLVAFRSCGELLSYARAGAVRAGGTVGVPLRAGAAPQVINSPPPQRGGGELPAASAPAAAKDAAPFSATNVQEAGIDEPDVVKTDGRRIFTVTDSVLRVVDVTATPPRVVGTLPLEGYGHQLLLRGDRLLVTATTGGGPLLRLAPIDPGGGSGASTLLTEVDVSVPAAPRVARAMTVDGAFVDGRLSGSTARLVIGTTPDPILATRGRTVAQRARSAGLRRFLPRTVLRSRISGHTFRRPLARCSQVRRPRAFAGTGLLTVMTIDLDRGLYSVDRDAIMASAQTVYGSATSLYVASERYVPGLEAGGTVPAGQRTQIDRFDASQPGRTTYAASGDVPGYLLNQYALSESGGVLRAATTEQPPWLADGTQGGQSQSFVTVLAERDGRLAQVGQVGGLGRGERIYAVRFIGDVGYVVTFRQVDPLYTVDLSHPESPRVAGALKLTGFSAYLHPVGEGLLLGVGQEATAQGRLAGSQVSLFDVSDPAHPRRLAQQLLGAGSSTVEFDPHAFLWWAPAKLAVLPLQTYGGDQREFTGVAGLHAGREEGITDAGRVSHTGPGGEAAPIDRSLVIGDTLYTVSYLGVGAAPLGNLPDSTLTPFG